jgi:hypothetical protein
MIYLRFTDPEIDFWIDVRVRRFGRAWLAVADLASEPEPVAATRPDLAVMLALAPLGLALAWRLAAQVNDAPGWPRGSPLSTRDGANDTD